MEKDGWQNCGWTAAKKTAANRKINCLPFKSIKHLSCFVCLLFIHFGFRSRLCTNRFLIKNWKGQTNNRVLHVCPFPDPTWISATYTFGSTIEFHRNHPWHIEWYTLRQCRCNRPVLTHLADVLSPDWMSIGFCLTICQYYYKVICVQV